MRIRSALVTAAVFLGAASAALGASPAFASDNAPGATLYADQTYCGGAGSVPSVEPVDPAQVTGFANFQLNSDGTTVSEEFHLKGALPDTTYDVYAYSNFCSFDKYLGAVTTNHNGVANLTGTFTIPAGGTVWNYAQPRPYNQENNVETAPQNP